MTHESGRLKHIKNSNGGTASHADTNKNNIEEES